MKLKNSTLKNKLKSYSVLSGSLLAAGAANGQIIYHAVNPPVTLSDSGATYSLDLNGDNDTDFVLSEFKATNTVRAQIGFHNGSDSLEGSILKTNGRRYGYPSVLAPGAVIGSTAKWFNYAGMKHNPYYPPVLAGSYIAGGFAYGKWEPGETNKFIGLKLRVINGDTTTYYGWARCSVVTKGTSMTIFGYAYQSIPDSSIMAGDTDSAPNSVNNHSLENLQVYSFGKNVVVKYPGAARDGMTIVVRDILGREIEAKQTNNEMYEFYLANEASGIYTVSVQSKQAEITRKVSIH